MDIRNLSGPLKAAILIRSLGPEVTSTVFDGLSEDEKKVVRQHLDQVGAISTQVAEYVAREFMANAAKKSRFALRAPGASNDKAASDRSDGKDAAEEAQGLAAILALSADEIYELVKDEHPQTIAIILIHLKTAVASDVVARLPDEIKTDVAVRIVNLEKVNSIMIEEVNAVFTDMLKNKKSTVTNISGGVDRLAEILNQTDEISSELILNEIEDTDSEMAAQIKQKMFVFEDLVLVDDRGFQKLLRKVETMELAIALKAASEEVKDKVFKNMSERAGAMLREEMEDLGPVRMNEVSDAQTAITNIIQEMEAKGEIIISGRRGEEIIA
ncbi:MAG: flagellar motor switch protein FliG [Deltaproteobacteria bacterium]|jgi:flagellar motor switch protein FliG|nr:flagellar motor switch protein FliG [Deltaproteobacteria bacterium]MBW2482840.1 flagellar motor switch protein FliG [Deltaproteobacteria bacterium]